jgi:ankyrin repeat protein
LIARTFGILNYRYVVVEKIRVPKAEEICRPSQQTLDDMLSQAVKCGDRAWFNTAIVLGASPHATVRDGSSGSESAIVLAASRRNAKMVRALLEHGAYVDEKGPGWCTALAEAGDHFEIVSLLLSRGANPNAGHPGDDSNPLVDAAWAGAVDCLRLMIDHGGDPGRADWTGNVLHETLRTSSPECVSLLLDHGADPNAVLGGTGDTPLHLFAERDDGERPDDSLTMLGLMRAAGAVPLRNEAGVFPVEIARRNARMSQEVLRWFEEWIV